MTTHTEMHTPGPWTVHTLANGQHTVCGPIATAGYEAAVAQIPSEPTIFDAATRATNAALIAAAPETARKLAALLEAAEDAHDMLDEFNAEHGGHPLCYW